MTVIMVVLIAQSRVLFNMGRDGLLPKSLGRVSRVYSSPARAATAAGVAALVLTLYPKVIELEELLVIGALFCFAFCAVGVLRLRRTEPNLERGFRVPMVPLVPLLSLAATLWLMLNLKTSTWRTFLDLDGLRTGHLRPLRPLAQPAGQRGELGLRDRRHRPGHRRPAGRPADDRHRRAPRRSVRRRSRTAASTCATDLVRRRRSRCRRPGLSTGSNSSSEIGGRSRHVLSRRWSPMRATRSSRAVRRGARREVSR